MTISVKTRPRVNWSALALGAAALTFSAPVFAADAAMVCPVGFDCSKWGESPNQNVSPPVITDLTSSTLEWSRVSDRTIPGLGPNERLCPTDCPVDVMTPSGSEVLDCYKICTPVSPQAETKVQTQPQPTVSLPVQPARPVTTPMHHAHIPHYEGPITTRHFVSYYAPPLIYALPQVYYAVPAPVYYASPCGFHIC